MTDPARASSAAIPTPERTAAPPVTPAPHAAPLVLLGADDGVVCVDDLCVTLPPETAARRSSTEPEPAR